MNNLYKSQLQKFRKENYTQNEFSEAIDITYSYYAKIENGYNSPSVPVHIGICLKLQKPSDCFFKEGRDDMVLTVEQVRYLKTLSPAKLKNLLELLQTTYEGNKQ